jgi:cbb3-type cytochrome c oxidase subunit III
MAALAVLIGLSALAAAAANSRLLETDPEELERTPALLTFASLEAAPLFSWRCAGCHGQDMKGDKALGAPDLTDGEWIYGQGRIGDIEQTITYGIRSGDPRSHNLSLMPAFASPTPYGREKLSPLTPRQIDDLATYLIAIEGRGESDPASARRGQALYLGQGGCYDCHTGDARGDSFVGAPSLRSGTRLYGDGSKGSIAASIAQGRSGVCPAFHKRLSPAGIRALASLIYVKSHPGRPPAH